MKIAVAGENNSVAGHFGHCAEFIIFTTDAAGKQVTDVQSIPNPGHKPGFLPNFLHEKGAQVIISGGMGQGAIDIFDAHGIKVITGASGDAKTAVEDYLSGKLVSNGAVCQHHDHHHEC